MTDERLAHMADLLRRRNAIDAEIARVTGRPMTAGHLGEWIAAHVFDIELEPSAVAAAIDGRFLSGALAGRTVNVKWYLKREGFLDVATTGLVDYYLVFTGPKTSAASSRRATRPWRVDSVYLFDARQVVANLERRGAKIGVASSVPVDEWEAAEIHPRSRVFHMPLTEQQQAHLRLFANT